MRGEDPSLGEGLGGFLLGFSLLQLLHKLIDSCELLRDVDILRTMWIALTAIYAMVSLTKRRNRAVVTDEVYPASLLIVLSLLALWHITFVHASVIMGEDAWDVNAVRARHTILTVVARYGRVAHDKVCRLALKPVHLFLCQWLQRTERADVILKMLHIGHA